MNSSSALRLLYTRFIVKECPLLIKEVNDNASVILNRPKSLNAMDLSLLKKLYETLRSLELKKSTVILKGAGDKAFSAGGDLLLLKKAGATKDLKYMHDLSVHMNLIIYLLYNYKVPVVALLNGITFGAGAGCSYFAKYKIATEKTKWGMPETKLGFHPNAAATFFFNRPPGKLGYYLGLMGSHLIGSDILNAGYATHYCKSDNLLTLEEELLNNSNSNNIEKIIEHYSEKNIPAFSLDPIMQKIDHCFGGESVEDIISKLRQDGSLWAKETLDKLCQYSPTSLKVTLRQLQKGKNMELKDSLMVEKNLTMNFYNYADVYEGTRIILEDKNSAPKWNPSKLSSVTDDLVEQHFLPNKDEYFQMLLMEIDSRKL